MCIRDSRTYCVHVERRTLVNQMTGHGVVWSERQAGNRLTVYDGAWPARHWNTRTAVLNSTRCRTGSQWSCLKVGVMCSQRRTPVTSRAAAFWTDCRKCMLNIDRKKVKNARNHYHTQYTSRTVSSLNPPNRNFPKTFLSVDQSLQETTPLIRTSGRPPGRRRPELAGVHSDRAGAAVYQSVSICDVRTARQVVVDVGARW